MSESIGSINPNIKDKQIQNIAAVDGNQKKFESDDQKEIANKLLKESEGYSESSKEKAEEAKKYVEAAQALEQMANAVRARASLLKNKEIDEVKKKEIIKEISEVVGNKLEFPVPKDASPELLEQIADTLEAKAKENRLKADDLLISSEQDEKLSKQLKEQAGILKKKNLDFSDLDLKSKVAHNEGLSKILKMMGVARLDAEYRDQLAMIEKSSGK